VDFIDDEDFVSITSRAIGQTILEFTNFVDAVVTSAVNFANVDVIARSNLATSGAFKTRSRRGTGIG
jgi:hypothetical protein